MKSYTPVLVILLTVTVFVSGCIRSAGPKCPTCPSPSTWSECDQESAKTRTNYQCGQQTNYSCESYLEKATCQTKIEIKGGSGLAVVITPTLDENVKGVIRVEAVAVPPGTEKVSFLFYPQDINLEPNMTKADLAKLVREDDSSGADGWKALFDTAKVKNGLYKIFIGPTYSGAPEEDPWIDFTTTQVIVKN